ncbi:hyaluronidase PH-20-like [Acanthopagrus latus]|uniref:hyaluronidase PH-20-like n=1 Tax=Acanthopagrus latus TaxID=8177 RepID=UPI00187CAD7F|nr:hyaluronidase PH-20-like [Acanthopagrus latus]XP_036964349.1 hyaluronidase PH-20-like [Acanthopagrus latus]
MQTSLETVNSLSQVTEESGRDIMSFLSCIPLVVMGSISAILALPPTEPPLIKDHPFVAIWNAPTEKCQQLDIPLDTSAFQAVTSPAIAPGQFLTIFYENRLGRYPKVDTIKHKLYNGGFPQKGNLTEHLAKARQQIDYYISQDSSPGLAVIDWESWRPLWDQNFGLKRIYQKLSINHARQKAPFSSSREIFKLAKSQFEQAGRLFMEKTISLGIGERPSRRWGFYLFPDCRNYGWNKSDYTGKCSSKTQKQNNQMMWLWEHSTALFPSIYLHLSLKNSPKAVLYVRHRVEEAVRVAMLPKRPYTIPIYVYSRPLYRQQTRKYLSKMDLVSTIGESAALGAAGVVMWGATQDYNNKVACQSLSDYLTSTFNPYIANVTAAATLCSEVLCQGKGRCIRRSYNSSDYLHLNPDNFSILRANRKYVAVGRPSAADLSVWAQNFTCQCYTGGKCSPRLQPPTTIKIIWV